MSFLDVALKALTGPFSSKPEVSSAPKDVGGPVVATGGGNLLDPELRDTLRSIARRVTEPSDITEQWQINRVRRNREYFAGKQNTFWAEDLGVFLPINGSTLSAYGVAEDDDEPDPMLVWNLHQATGLYIIAVLSGGVPTVRFFPANAENQYDVATAKASNTIAELFYRTNDIESLLGREAYYLYNDGICFFYVRHVVDGQRFGSHLEDVKEMMPAQTAPDRMVCPNCQQHAPGGIDLLGSPCPGVLPPQGPGMPPGQCGRPFEPGNFRPAEMAMVPQVTGQKTVPNGGEVVDVFGRLEVRVPPGAKDLDAAQFLILRTECPVSDLRYRYPEMAREINSSYSDDGPDVTARLARQSTQQGGWQSATGYSTTDNQDTVTYSRIWLRPSVFYTLEETQRDQLLAQFPDGCYVELAGNTFLMARNENLSKFWVVCHAYPGDGMVRPSIGEVLLDPQDALNDLMDSELQNARMSVPQIFVDKETVDKRAWMQARQRGGSIFSVSRRAGEAIGDNFWQSQPAAINPGTSGLRQEVFGPISQYLSATLPGMTGQSDPNLKTARAYAQAKEQAMGRMGIVWRSMKAAHVELVTLAVRHFIDNRSMDVTLPQITPAGFENANIRIADLHGQVVAYPESDEAYPISASDKRQVYDALLQNPDPKVHGIATELDNLDYAKGTMGWGGLTMPGEKSRAKQMKEIAALLQGKPQQVPAGPPPMDPTTGGPMIDPRTGQPVPPPMKFISSIPVKLKTDEHNFEFQTCVSWLHSEEGLKMEQTNPTGFSNVQAHAEEHFDAMHPPAPPPEKPGPPGQPPPSPGGPPGPAPQPSGPTSAAGSKPPSPGPIHPPMGKH